MTESSDRRHRGRGSAGNPRNRFQSRDLLPDFEHLDGSIPLPEIPTEVSWDRSKTILSENSSPDIPFRWSLNPYRGCEHGCSYCYARPSHEQLGFSAGLDFESKIVAKENAASLLRNALRKDSWQRETIAIASVTDAWQPIEQELRITRSLLEVLAEARQPTSLITKNRLLLRDLDLLEEMARVDAVTVQVSLTTLSPSLSRKMEPRASTPEARLHLIRRLAEQGISVGVMLGPIIPGLSDHEIPDLLRAAEAAGAKNASWLLLRLPGAVETLFVAWLHRELPERAEKVLGRIRELRGGALNDSRFDHRNRGEGDYAKQLSQLFEITRVRLGLQKEAPEPQARAFRKPRSDGPEQLDLFDLSEP